jgi:hypothetical protein
MQGVPVGTPTTTSRGGLVPTASPAAAVDAARPSTLALNRSPGFESVAEEEDEE